MKTQNQTNQEPKNRIQTLGGFHRRFAVVLSAVLLACQAWSQDAAAGAKQVIPVVEIQSVVIRDAVKSLARQAGINYILDPQLSGAWPAGSEGKPAKEPSITVRWEKTTAEDALRRLLKENGLELIFSPATSTARIAFTNEAVKPIPANRVGAGANKVIPLLELDCSLDSAITLLAHHANVALSVDPSLPLSCAGSAVRPISQCNVSVRWEKMTAPQALAALLDNYDLVIAQEKGSSPAKFVLKNRVQKATPAKAE